MPQVSFGQKVEEPLKERHSDELIKSLIKFVNEKVSIFDVLDLYGIQYPYPRGHSQKLRCIFPEHPDRSPSAKIDAPKNRYTCYSRCDGGDPIFVCKKLGGFSSVGQTIAFLNTALCLHLEDAQLAFRPDSEDPMFWKKEAKRLQKPLDDLFISIRHISTPMPQHEGIMKRVEKIWGEWEEAVEFARTDRSPEGLSLIQYQLRSQLEAEEFGAGYSRRVFEEDQDDELIFRWGNVQTTPYGQGEACPLRELCPVP